MMEGLSKNEVSILFGELGGTPETISFSQVGVSPAREATFSTLGGFSVKCFPRVLPYVVPGVATGVASGVAPGVARAVGQTKKSEVKRARKKDLYNFAVFLIFWVNI